MQSFWDVLADAMGRPEMKTAFDNPYVMRQFGDFYAVLLLNNVARTTPRTIRLFPTSDQCR